MLPVFGAGPGRHISARGFLVFTGNEGVSLLATKGGVGGTRSKSINGAQLKTRPENITIVEEEIRDETDKTGRQADRQAGRQAGRQRAGRQAGRQADAGRSTEMSTVHNNSA